MIGDRPPIFMRIYPISIIQKFDVTQIQSFKAITYLLKGWLRAGVKFLILCFTLLSHPLIVQRFF